jgi:hypothetical protein
MWHAVRVWGLSPPQKESTGKIQRSRGKKLGLVFWGDRRIEKDEALGPKIT